MALMILWNVCGDCSDIKVHMDGSQPSQSLKDLHNSYHIHEYTEEDMIRRRKKASYKCDGEHTSFEEPLSNSWNAVIFQIPMEYLKKNVKR